jgi:hypothetical protein
MCTGSFDCKPPLIIQKETFQNSETTFNIIINRGPGITKPVQSMVQGPDDPLFVSCRDKGILPPPGRPEGSGAHPAALYSMVTRVLPPGVKRSGGEAGNSPPSTKG